MDYHHSCKNVDKELLGYKGVTTENKCQPYIQWNHYESFVLRSWNARPCQPKVDNLRQHQVSWSLRNLRIEIIQTREDCFAFRSGESQISKSRVSTEVRFKYESWNLWSEKNISVAIICYYKIDICRIYLNTKCNSTGTTQWTTQLNQFQNQD